MSDQKKIETIEAYIDAFPKDTQRILKQLRQVIREVVPAEATEVISYGIPTFKLKDKYVVYFAGYKQHVSLYPIPRDEALREELSLYASGKGTLQFPLDQPLPHDLIKKVVRLLTEENQRRTSGY